MAKEILFEDYIYQLNEIQRQAMSAVNREKKQELQQNLIELNAGLPKDFLARYNPKVLFRNGGESTMEDKDKKAYISELHGYAEDQNKKIMLYKNPNFKTGALDLSPEELIDDAETALRRINQQLESLGEKPRYQIDKDQRAMGGMPENYREPKIVGGVIQLLKLSKNEIIKGIKKGNIKLEEYLEKRQGIDNTVIGETPSGKTKYKTPGTTATDRGAVIGKERTKAFGKAKVIKGGIFGAAGVTLTSALIEELADIASTIFKGEDPSNIAIISKASANDDTTTYSLEELPKEKGGTIGSGDFVLYRNNTFKREAIDARKNGKNTFISDMNGAEYDTVKVLDTLNTFDTPLDTRIAEQDGGQMAMPPELMEQDVPVDTYPNMTPEEEAMPIASDEQMQEDYVDYVTAEVLTQDEQDYLNTALDNDPQLEGILDKVVTYAAEFTGEGEVEGPGTGISDSIPARLSDGEFVITEKATNEIGADNLQTMMDEAERAADGGKVAYALGGAVENSILGGSVKPLTPETPLADEKVSMYGNLRQQEEMKKQMMYANRMPSIIGR